MSQDFYVTTPIYYINGNPHVGHIYTTIAADIVARLARTRGPAFFLTGTDEHGEKVAEAARAAGADPQTWCDSLVGKWQALCAAYAISNDAFIRTTQPQHVSTVQEAFRRLRERGDVYLGKYEGWYCKNDETFWPQAKLIDGRCPNPECRRAVEWLSENDWFFALSRYRDRLLEHYRKNPHAIRPEQVYNEVMALLEGGLDDLSISRAGVSWGIPVPDGEGVIYVWFDALLNYISALGWPSETERFTRFWPARVQVLGKDITRFHCVIWPAVLWALELSAPELLFGHGWLTVAGEKMSKSKGNVTDPFALAEYFGADSVRYFLFREAAFGADFNFSEEKVRGRHNGDLGNDLGNLFRRTLAMLERYREGRVPARSDAKFGATFGDLPERVYTLAMRLQFREALLAIWELVSALNREIDERKPWVLHKGGEHAALDALLYDLCEGLRWLALLLAPFLPQKAAEMWNQLGLQGAPDGDWRTELRWGLSEPGTQTVPGAPLFPRLDA